MRCTITRTAAAKEMAGRHNADRPSVKVVARQPMSYSVAYLNSGIAFSWSLVALNTA
jgi:hypothetical protein